MLKMQYLLKCLVDHSYVYQFKSFGEFTTIYDICWAHPESANLFSIFLIVFSMNSTSKTCHYKMSLFEIAEVTSIQLTYSVDFDF